MKKFLILLLFININLFAQNESQVGWIAKFGGAVGFSPVVLFPDYDAVNLKLTSLGLEQLKGSIYAPGGSGYIYVMIIDNMRLGGLAFSGSQSTEVQNGSFENQVVYSLNGGGFTIEYTMPFVKKIALSAGLILGGGSLDIQIYQNNNSFNWDDIWIYVKNISMVTNKSYKLNNSFYLVSPTVNVDIPINRFIALRGGLGYQFTFGDSWNIANNKELKNVPSNLNGNSFFIQTGIYIGLFAF